MHLFHADPVRQLLGGELRHGGKHPDRAAGGRSSCAAAVDFGGGQILWGRAAGGTGLHQVPQHPGHRQRQRVQRTADRGSAKGHPGVRLGRG